MTPMQEPKKSKYCIEFKHVQEASNRIQNIAHKTPILTSTSINKLLLCENKQMKLFFKVEALQKTGSFKFRGALNATLALKESRILASCEQKVPLQEKSQIEKDKDLTNSNTIHVVTHSSGNHAQALALSAQMASSSSSSSSTTFSSSPNIEIKSTIVMPRNAPQIKQKAVQSYGANIVLCENNSTAREQKAKEILANSKNPITSFIHPSEDPLVIAGQGTVSLEAVSQIQQLLSTAPQPSSPSSLSQNQTIQEHTTDNNNKNASQLDIMVIPVGGGGLASGNAIALRGLLGTKVKIILAEPETLNDAKRSKDAGKLLKHEPNNTLSSVADGLKTTLGPNTWPIVRDLVDDIITVSERDILKATKLIWERLKICIEPSAGVGVAVVLGEEFSKKYGSRDQNYNNVGVILCGGNVDVIKVTKYMEEMGL